MLQGQGPLRQQLSLVCNTTLIQGQNSFHLKLSFVCKIPPCCVTGTRPVASATQPCMQHNPHAVTEPISSETQFCMQKHHTWLCHRDKTHRVSNSVLCVTQPSLQGQNLFRLKLNSVCKIPPGCITGTRPIASATQPCV